ncbi:hypothetical protein [Nocardia asiatica]
MIGLRMGFFRPRQLVLGGEYTPGGVLELREPLLPRLLLVHPPRARTQTLERVIQRIPRQILVVHRQTTTSIREFSPRVRQCAQGGIPLSGRTRRLGDGPGRRRSLGLAVSAMRTVSAACGTFHDGFAGCGWRGPRGRIDRVGGGSGEFAFEIGQAIHGAAVDVVQFGQQTRVQFIQCPGFGRGLRRVVLSGGEPVEPGDGGVEVLIEVRRDPVQLSECVAEQLVESLVGAPGRLVELRADALERRLGRILTAAAASPVVRVLAIAFESRIT